MTGFGLFMVLTAL